MPTGHPVITTPVSLYFPCKIGGHGNVNNTAKMFSKLWSNNTWNVNLAGSSLSTDTTQINSLHAELIQENIKIQGSLVYASSQWEQTLHVTCNIVSHWPGTCREWSLNIYIYIHIYMYIYIYISHLYHISTLQFCRWWKSTLMHDKVY